MNKRHYEHTLPNIRGSLSNTYVPLDEQQVERLARLIIGQTVRNIRYGTDRKERITAPGGAVPLF